MESTSGDAITAAAHQVAATIGAAAIATYTTSGSTTLRAARERPGVPILCLTAHPDTARRLALSYAVRGIITPDVKTFGQMVERAARSAQTAGVAHIGQQLVVTAGVPFGTPGNTNTLRIARIEERLTVQDCFRERKAEVPRRGLALALRLEPRVLLR